MDLTRLPLVPARLRFGKRKSTRLIVIHTAECAETPGAAEGVARWFQDARAQGSAHATVDVDSIVQHMDWDEKAAHARGGDANATGIGIEHAGRAAQSAAEWADEYSTAMLDRSAQLVAVLASRYNIPLVWLTPAQVRAGARGICGHADVTAAYSVRGGHTDPGPNFPTGRYMDLLRRYAGIGTPAPTPVPPSPSAEALRRWVAGTIVPEASTMKTPLRRGAQGPAVRTLQRSLNVVANAGLAEDGHYGPGTEQAVKSFQRFFKLTADGVVGPKTKAMLVFCLERIRSGA